MKNITLRTNTNKIINLFKNCKVIDAINLKTKSRYIYKIGGILNKLENGIHYFAINNQWVKA